MNVKFGKNIAYQHILRYLTPANYLWPREAAKNIFFYGLAIMRAMGKEPAIKGEKKIFF